MSSLYSLFESTSAPSQTYAKQPLLTQRFERDPSLRRVLVQKEYFDGIPQRVSVIGHLMHHAAQKAQIKSGAAPLVWDAIITNLATIMTSFDQELAIAGHLTDQTIPSKPTVAVQGDLLGLWTNLLKERANHKKLIAVLELWCTTLSDLANDPASDQFAPAYFNHAQSLTKFCQSLGKTLEKAPDAEITEPTFANSLGDELAGSSAIDEAATPRSFNKAMNHDVTQEDASRAVAWMVSNTSGAIWSGELLNFMSSLEDVAEYVQDMNADSMFSGELNGKASRKIATSLNFVSTAAQRTILTGLTKGLREAGVWDNTPSEASDREMPASLARLFNDYDYLDLRDNILFALASVGGKAMFDIYNKVPTALHDAAKAIDAGKLVTELSETERSRYEAALILTASKLERALQPMRVMFSNLDMYSLQVPAIRLVN
jgi:hypothetical protein